MTTSTSRRRFLKTTGATGLISILPRHFLARAREAPPSEKLNIAGIGVGGMGGGNLRQMERENIVALCDVDHAYAARTFKRYPNARAYTDFRVMLEKQTDIDAVLIATPDHTHAVIAMAAMQAGKHVYCQKPLARDVYECRRLAEAAKEHGVVTQMGIQGHSGEGIRLITEWIAADAIGDVRRVDAWCSLSYYPFGHAGWSSKWGGGRPADTPAVPATLDWDLFLGPAPERPYHPAYHPRVWRCWRDFGSGMMGDRGAHTFDPIVTALGLTAPTSIEATSMGSTKEVYQLSSIVTYRFPARGTRPPVNVTWYEGTRPPRPPELEDGRRLPKEGGVLFKGSKGTIMCGVYGGSPRLIPEAAMQAMQRPEKTIPRVNGSHEQDWIRACKQNRPAGADFAYSGPLTEICQLGNVAIQVDAPIEWDSEGLRITSNPAANSLIRRDYRDGWSLGW